LLRELMPASPGSAYRRANSLPKSLPAGMVLLDIDHSLLCHVPDDGSPTAVLKSALSDRLAETQPIRYYSAKMMRFHADRYG